MSFSTLCSEHGAQAKQVYRCCVDGQVLDKEQLAKGYELGRGKFLRLTPDELEEISPAPDPELRVDAAYRLVDVDPRLWTGQCQYLAADVGDGPVTDLAGARDFARFANELATKGLLAVGRWSTRGADRLVGIYAVEIEGGARLVLQGMRRSGEVRDLAEIPPAGEAEPGGEIGAVLKRLTVTHLDTGSYPDDRYRMTCELLAKKAAQAALEEAKPKKKKAAR